MQRRYKFIVVVCLVIVAIVLIRRKKPPSTVNESESTAEPVRPPPPPLPPVETRTSVRGRWVRLERTGGSEWVHVAGLWAYGEDAFGPHIPPAGGTVHPVYTAEPTPIANLWDGNPNTYATTDNAVGAYLEIDLGSEHNLGHVKIENRRDDQPIRIKGTTLVVYDGARKQTARFPIEPMLKDYHVWFTSKGSGEIDTGLSSTF